MACVPERRIDVSTTEMLFYAITLGCLIVIGAMVWADQGRFID